MLRRALLLSPLLAAPVLAQPAWPSRPVRVVVPFPPGGSNDAIARPLAESLARQLGQTFVVENRGGAGSTLGTAEVARAPADGHALLVTSSTFATSAAVQPTPYSAARDLQAVAIVAEAPLLMLAAPGFPAATMDEAVALIRSRPGAVTYGSAGPGSIGHMAGALFALHAGELNTVHMPYRGTGPVLNDMLAGTVDLTFTSLSASAGLVGTGRLKLLGWTTETVVAGWPAAPTPHASGLPDYEAGIWWAAILRRGTPEAIRERLNAAIRAAVAEARFAASLASEGATAGVLPADAADARIGTELTKWRDVASHANIRTE
ncbi:tripartite tricarboxylate transporter substrate-binding protein [Sabulicella glaciei]|uniref:Tripartite tricarboxylate transporter substrate-binding protein n=1 Tax=Sabulicella glaciei TaxID=2984948 RepID=A0ABT3NZI3_9PROT|nr:tripartite tricarboxylate transporter substrate-binding protein [Roseococcus sp. MDT2-1-1]MCW8087574.1 tripartite tricarboxylate transporter substrate-binding protein [Roseococcus sp. MDT2-1-1]